MKEPVTKVCPMCRREFECYGEVRGGKRRRIGCKRRYNAVTCSPRCSREYNRISPQLRLILRGKR